MEFSLPLYFSSNNWYIKAIDFCMLFFYCYHPKLVICISFSIDSLEFFRYLINNEYSFTSSLPIFMPLFYLYWLIPPYSAKYSHTPISNIISITTLNLHQLGLFLRPQNDVKLGDSLVANEVSFWSGIKLRESRIQKWIVPRMSNDAFWTFKWWCSPCMDKWVYWSTLF